MSTPSQPRLPGLATAALLLCLSALCFTTAVRADDDGWNYTPIKGVTNKQAAWQQALQAAPPGNGTEDPRIPGWWASFKAKFYKKYDTPEAEETAYNNFKERLNVILDVNQDLSTPFWLTGNQYADYDLPAFREKFLMKDINFTRRLKGRLLRDSDPIPHDEIIARRRLQGSSVDWRAAGRMTPVKDQGGCGSCWAYAATGAIEASYLITFGLTPQQALIDLSEQQLIDCCTVANGYGSSGCGGGSSDSAIQYNSRQYQVTEALYPATYSDGSCRYPAGTGAPANAAVALASSTIYITTMSESLLMQGVQKGPTVIYFEVVGDFFSYSGGIYVPTTCGTNINHAMVAVGYVYTGDRSSSYWIIRNSWSANWGLNGYAQIQMTGTNTGACAMYQFLFQPPQAFTLTLPGGGSPAVSPSPPPPTAPVFSPPPPTVPVFSPPPPDVSPPPPRRIRSPTPPRPPPRPPRRRRAPSGRL